MVHTEQEFNELFKAFNKLKKTAYFPETQDSDGEITASKFGGQPWLALDETWPQCGNCGSYLQFFFQLNLGAIPPDMQAKFGEKGLIQLFYCLHCEDFAPFDTTNLIRIVYPTELNSNLPQIDIPDTLKPYPIRLITGWEAAEEYPETDELSDNLEVILDNKQRFAWDQLAEDYAALDEYWPRPHLGDKLSGWPHWIQGLEYTTCPRCQKQMQVIFQLDSEDNLPYMFGDSGCSYILQCPIHKETLGYSWACM